MPEKGFRHRHFYRTSLRQFGISVPATGSVRDHWAGTSPALPTPSLENKTNLKFKGHCNEINICLIDVDSSTYNDYYATL